MLEPHVQKFVEQAADVSPCRVMMFIISYICALCRMLTSIFNLVVLYVQTIRAHIACHLLTLMIIVGVVCAVITFEQV
jgi:hypothetical protein